MYTLSHRDRMRSLYIQIGLFWHINRSLLAYMRLCVHTLSPRQNAFSLPQNMFWYYSRMCCLTTEYPRCLQNVFSLPQNMFSYHRTCSLTVTAICDLSSTYIECVLLPQNMFWYYSRMCCLTTEYPRCLQNVFSLPQNMFSRMCSECVL